MLRQRALHRKMWQWVWLNRYRMFCLQPALDSEKSSAVSRSLVVACVPLIRRRVFSLSPHRPVLCSHWHKVRMCSRRMTAPLNVDVRFAHTITAPGCPVETWLEGFEGANSLQRMMSVPWMSEQVDRPHRFRYLGGEGGADSRASHKSCGNGAEE